MTSPIIRNVVLKIIVFKRRLWRPYFCKYCLTLENQHQKIYFNQHFWFCSTLIIRLVEFLESRCTFSMSVYRLHRSHIRKSIISSRQRKPLSPSLSPAFQCFILSTFIYQSEVSGHCSLQVVDVNFSVSGMVSIVTLIVSVFLLYSISNSKHNVNNADNILHLSYRKPVKFVTGDMSRPGESSSPSIECPWRFCFQIDILKCTGNFAVWQLYEFYREESLWL